MLEEKNMMQKTIMTDMPQVLASPAFVTTRPSSTFVQHDVAPALPPIETFSAT